MIIHLPIGPYRWIEDWVTIPSSPIGKINGRTHGIAVSKSGNVILFHQADPAVLLYSPAGELLESWGNFPGAHGLTLVEEDGMEYLWLVDETTKQVVKTTLKGDVVQSLEAPRHPAYAEAKYVPTWAAVSEKRWNGNGDIWLADGYGASLVHRYDAAGRLLQTLDGTEGAGRFQCPHGISVVHRKGKSELYIADRGNKRFQVFDLDGNYLRSFGEEFLTSPDGCNPMGDHLIVPELVARLSILDADDKPISLVGENDQIAQQSGWPNNRELIEPGKFNSPHAAAADSAGNIYVVEWMTGGRVTKLEKLG